MFLLIWISAYLLNYKYDIKIYRNYLHIIHILLYSIVYLFSTSYENLSDISTSFYIVDILYLIKINNKLNKLLLNYSLYHHILTIIILNYYFIPIVKFSMFLLELSNLSICYVYNKIKIKKLKLTDLIIQCIIYIPIRCIITPLIIYKSNKLDNIMIIFSIVFFIFNIIYSIKLSLITSKEIYKKLIDNCYINLEQKI